MDVPGSARRRGVVLGMLVAGASAACGDGTTEPGESLSPREAEALFLGMMGLAVDPTASLVSGTPVDGVIACPLGGEATRVYSEVPEPSEDSTSSTIGITLDPDRCVLSSEGWDFTVDGNPEFRIVMTSSSTGTDLEFELEMTFGGAVDWELDDRWGTCVFDMAFVGGAVQNFAEPQWFGEGTGTVCGVDVERFDPGVGAPVGGG